MAHEVTLITGDGVGPELAAAARRCVDATGVKIQWDVQEAGVEVMERTGTPLPEATMESVRRTRCALKAPITTPVGTGFRSLNVHMRQALGLFACIRPCKYYPGVRTFFSDRAVDLVIVRENTEDLYAGIEFEAGQPATGELFDYLNKISPQRPIRSGRAETGISIKPISVSGTERIVRCAFEYARENGRKKVTAVHKANIMKHSDGLFLATARKGRRAVPRHRLRGPHRRQHVHAACAEAGAVRRAGAAEPLRRHRQRPGGGPGGRIGRGARGEHRPRAAPSSRPPTAARRNTKARTRSIPRP